MSFIIYLKKEIKINHFCNQQWTDVNILYPIIIIQFKTRYLIYNLKQFVIQNIIMKSQISDKVIGISNSEYYLLNKQSLIKHNIVDKSKVQFNMFKENNKLQFNEYIVFYESNTLVNIRRSQNSSAVDLTFINNNGISVSKTFMSKGQIFQKFNQKNQIIKYLQDQTIANKSYVSFTTYNYQINQIQQYYIKFTQDVNNYVIMFIKQKSDEQIYIGINYPASEKKSNKNISQQKKSAIILYDLKKQIQLSIFEYDFTIQKVIHFKSTEDILILQSRSSNNNRIQIISLSTFKIINYKQTKNQIYNFYVDYYTKHIIEITKQRTNKKTLAINFNKAAEKKFTYLHLYHKHYQQDYGLQMFQQILKLLK